MTPVSSATQTPDARPQAYRAIYTVGKPGISAIQVGEHRTEKPALRHPDVIAFLEGLGHKVEITQTPYPDPVWSHENEAKPVLQGLAERGVSNWAGPVMWSDDKLRVETPTEQGQAQHRETRRLVEAAIREAGLVIADIECQTVHSSNVCQPLNDSEPEAGPVQEAESHA